LKVTGESMVQLMYKEKYSDVEVFVIKNARRNLLGMNEIRKFEILAVINSLSIRKSEFKPVEEFPKVFTGLGTMPDVFRINLSEDVKPYRLCAPRSIPVGLRDKAKLELDNMLKLEVIEPVEEPTEWCSGLTIAPKANGNIRMCVDLTILNKGVARELYPLPRVSDMLSKLCEGTIFSKIDANSLLHLGVDFVLRECHLVLALLQNFFNEVWRKF